MQHSAASPRYPTPNEQRDESSPGPGIDPHSPLYISLTKRSDRDPEPPYHDADAACLFARGLWGRV